MRQTDPQCISIPKAASGLETNCMTQSMTQSMSLILMLVGSLTVGAPQGNGLQGHPSVCTIMIMCMIMIMIMLPDLTCLVLQTRD